VTRILSCLALAVVCALPASAQVAVRADVLHTMAGSAVADGVVVIGRDGKVERVGPAASTPVPKGYRVLRARVATPGLIDAHTVVGLAGALNQPHDQMQLDRSAPLQPELRALDAYNPREVLVEWVRNHGTTTLHTGHAPGALLSGQTMIVKTRPGPVEDVVIEPAAMLAVTLGPQGLAETGKAPGTRAKSVAMLRSELVKAREHVTQAGTGDEKRPARDLRLEALARVVRREQPLLVTADRLVDLHAALRLAREFDIRLVLDGAAEAYLLLDAIKAAGVPVLLHPMMRRGVGESENMSTATASALREAGVPSPCRAATRATCRRRAWCCSRRRLPPRVASPSSRRSRASPSTPRASSASTAAWARSKPARTATWHSTTATPSSTRRAWSAWSSTAGGQRRPALTIPAGG
jgi:imidazolonepropionase-like amidohydrolase